MADDFFDIVSRVSDGIGLAGAPVRGVRAFLRRDEARNLLQVIQREVEARWSQHAFRNDVYEQIARYLQNDALWVPFEAAAHGDANALEEVRGYLARHLGTESETASVEVAGVVVAAIEQHVGRAQTSPEAAVDVVGRLRQGQTERRFEAVDEGVADVGRAVARSERQILEAIRSEDRRRMAPARFRLPRGPELRGRGAELNTLAAAVSEGRIVAISGLGGVGKSALAVEIAHRQTDADRALLVPMRGLQESPAPSADLLAELLEAVGFSPDEIPNDLDRRSDLWRGMTTHPELVLILDDARDEAHVRPLLPGPETRLIITSRASLSGLDALLVPLDVLSVSGALEMLVDAAGESRVAQEPAGAAELCGLCGRLPLALSIAGRRLASRPAWRLEDLNVRLRDERRRLDALQAGDLAVRASFNLSYNLLGEMDARAFRRLGLFRSPLIREQAVMEVLDESASEGLERLSDLGLLESIGAGAYRIHDLLRIFASELFACEPRLERAEALTRLAHHVVEEASPRTDALEAPEADHEAYLEALSWFDAEWPTVVELVNMLEPEQLDAEVEAVALAVAQYGALRRRWEQWSSISRRAIASAERAGDRSAVARGHQNLGIALLESGDEAGGREQFEHAFRVSEELADPQGQARAIAQLGRADKDAGRIDASVEQLRRATALYSEAGDRAGEARALGDLGNALDAAGDLEAAVDAHRRALAAFAETGYARGEALEHGNLAIALAQLGDLMEAANEARRAVELHERLDDLLLAAKARLQLSGYLLDAGRPSDALEEAESSRLAYERLDETLGIGAATAARARVYAAREEHDLASADHDLADELFALAGADGERARHLAEVAETKLDVDDVTAARELLERAVALVDRPGMDELRVQLLGFLADVDDHAGDPEAAEQRLLAELANARHEGNELRLGLTLAALAHRHATWGEAEAARRLLDEARQLGMELAVERDDITDVVVVGSVSSADRRKLGSLVSQARFTLGVAIDRVRLDVRVRSAASGQADWWANGHGIGLHPWVVSTSDARSRLRLAATLYGALVHHVLARKGVDNATPLGETLLDIARAWVQHHVFVVHGPMPEESPALPSLSADSPGPAISTVLGAALAGNSVARTRLEDWERMADADDVVLVKQLEERLEPVTEPAQLIEAIVLIYDTAERPSDTADESNDRDA